MTDTSEVSSWTWDGIDTVWHVRDRTIAVDRVKHLVHTYRACLDLYRTCGLFAGNMSVCLLEKNGQSSISISINDDNVFAEVSEHKREADTKNQASLTNHGGCPT